MRSSDLDIDHIVSLSEAHESGLCAENIEIRRAFASDLVNIALTSEITNRKEKRGFDATEWLPEKNKCWFAQRIVDVRRKYRLTIDKQEANVLESVLRSCQSTSLDFPNPGAANVGQIPVTRTTLPQVIDITQVSGSSWRDPLTITVAGMVFGMIIAVTGLIWTMIPSRHVPYAFAIPGVINIKTSRPGVIPLVLGVLIVMVSIQSINNYNEYSLDTTVSFHPLTSIARSESAIDHARPKMNNKVSGWIFLGQASQTEGWSVTLEEISESSSLVVRPKRNVPIWSNVFRTLDGTLLGIMFRRQRPDKIGVAEQDSCFRIQAGDSITKTNLGELWIKVEQAPC